jgi:hypothetical protein
MIMAHLSHMTPKIIIVTVGFRGPLVPMIHHKRIVIIIAATIGCCNNNTLSFVGRLNRCDHHQHDVATRESVDR